MLSGDSKRNEATHRLLPLKIMAVHFPDIPLISPSRSPISTTSSRGCKLPTVEKCVGREFVWRILPTLLEKLYLVPIQIRVVKELIELL